MNVTAAEKPRPNLPTLIAWVSTCLLAGGFGPATGLLRDIWTTLGAFGLTAAVGLDVTARLRERRRRQKNLRSLALRYERELRSVVNERAASEELRTSVSHLLGGRPLAHVLGSGRRADERSDCDLAGEISPLGHDTEGNDNQSSRRSIRIHDISSSGFGLKLNEYLPPQLAILSLHGNSRETTDFLAEVLWCEANPEGTFTIGGRLIRVLSGTHSGAPVPCLVTAPSPMPEASQLAS